MQQIANRRTAVIKRQIASHWPRLVRFGMVGLVGMAVNMGTLFLLVEGARLNYLVAAALATEVAIISNFLLNDIWTFRGATPRRNWFVRGVMYNLVALGGMLISLAVLAVLTYAAGIYYLLANIFAIGAGIMWNYVLNSTITWGAPSSKQGTIAPAPAKTRLKKGRYRRMVTVLIREVIRLWT